MRKNIIYLDVDGVINAVLGGRIPTAAESGWSNWSVKKICGYPIAYSTEMLAKLTEWSERDDVEIKWLTTWEDQAVKDLSPAIGFTAGESFSVVPCSYWGSWTWWKLHAIKQLPHDPDTKIVWIDDDHAHEPEAASWVDSIPNPTLIVTPDTRTGLSVEAAHEIEAFLNT